MNIRETPRHSVSNVNWNKAVATAVNLPKILLWGIRKFFIYLGLSVFVFVDFLSAIKSQLVRRMFWGRGGLYKSSFHLSIIAITVLLLITNFANRLSILQGVEAQEELIFSYGSGGNTDLLQQGNSLQSVTAVNPGFLDFNVRHYVVQEGDTLDSIAADFGISKDTIKWANSKIISPFSDKIEIGWKLDIPEMNGVLYTVASGDNIDRIIQKTGGDKDTVIELNRIVPPRYEVAVGQRLFVPDGKLVQPTVAAARRPVTGGQSALIRSGVPFEVAFAALQAMPPGTFGNPLSDGGCAGYRYQRGLTSTHHGVDFSKASGCTLRAAAAGTVYKVAYDPARSGNFVIIDHGSGIFTNYFHGAHGTFQVQAGQRVVKGQPLMYMGCTGRCTGTHLHFELVAGDRYMNPLTYVPF